MSKITYTQSNVPSRQTFRTQKFSNLLSDTWQGEVYQAEDGTWTGWLLNWSNSHRDNCMFCFKTKKGATRWVNKSLRSVGIK